MITIMISENEDKAKEIISQILRKEGYGLSDKLDGNNIISVIKKENVSSISNIKDTVIELEKSLYDLKKGILYKSILEVIEKPILERALERADGNQLKAAKILGINRNTIRAKIKKLGINPDIYKQQ